MKITEKLNIRSRKDFFKFAIQFIKFGFVVASNTAISLAIVFIFISINRDWYIAGSTAGFIISVLNSYYWNNKYVFKEGKEGHLKALLKTYASYGCSSFLLGQILIWLMINRWGFYDHRYLAVTIGVLVTIPLNFILNKFWAFKDK